MELFLIICTIPLALVASLLVAALATALQTRAQLLRNRWGIIGLVAVWGIAILVLTVIAVTLFSANEYYKCGVGPKSTLSSTTITDLESRRIEVLVEYSLRIHLGRGKYDDTCHTTQEICVLADKVVAQAARQYFETGIGYGDVMNIVGLVTAIPAVLLLAVVLLLRKKSEVDTKYPKRRSHPVKHIVEYQNGNVLSYAEYGNRNGYPILVQHGLVASINEYHLFDRLIEAGNRLVCTARPGYGQSSPYQMANMAEWGEITSVLVDGLDLARFDVLGMSSGAPYSYAIGYKIPNKARNIYIFSGTPALYDDQVLPFWPYPVKKNASIAEMARVAKDVFFPNVTEKDLLRDEIKDSMMNDCFGIAQDLRLRCMDWGFTLPEVKQAVYMEHSQTDQEVPFIAAEMTAKMIPNCQLEVREGEHFSKDALDRFIRNTMLRQQESQ